MRITRVCRISWGLAVAVAAASTVAVAPAESQSLGRPEPVQVGPESGTIVAVGGALRSSEIYERFIKLAGGPDAHIVLIPTAGGAEDYDNSYRGLDTWREHGARNLTLLHTTDPSVADTDDFVEPLRSADGVYFYGGRQWILVDAYGGTATEEELRKVLDRGGVVGGSSAGATILGSFLVRGDTETNAIMMGDHQRGFGYLRDVAIDQHVLRRNRQFDLIEVIEAHPQLLGIGLDEDTAIVVRGDRFEVIGESYALIYDYRTTIGAEGKFYFLGPGQTFDMNVREVVGPRPIGNVQRVPWGRN
jgi:cyanophycinase